MHTSVDVLRIYENSGTWKILRISLHDDLVWTAPYIGPVNLDGE